MRIVIVIIIYAITMMRRSGLQNMLRSQRLVTVVMSIPRHRLRVHSLPSLSCPNRMPSRLHSVERQMLANQHPAEPMIYLYRTTDHWPIYSPWTGRLLTFDSADAAAADIIGPMQLLPQ